MNIPTAILLVDVQNEFLAPGGLLYDRVKDVIEKTGMMMFQQARVSSIYEHFGW